ncbi:NADP-dependent alcohol dehydrogenase [Parabacteroides sp. PF5-5]|uniref:iron-containing alcohol dehydrogenase n=1 Tax=unclassified Parabacteroides TaxID=2649774 RepID=UPI002474C396|nr:MULTISPECIES: iron-containing alcohol dehydrogenase [unclassified Parabacteroides]MDH6303982.1 NADP-dependent alcohol dehydrogenase [Parabacteroides sp. PH5-39]MDH6314598.1 NADP-dependent alcohol dehydrogenase [Parabacteroides sp. PF5-13]MDH6318337.1 NADP-dependent alcohol dehydrogenase [Parabacteroides sp. PH5-13]MDH6322371.1 NADP-dependent alcohol dehydrogenase [Parabacteroides sp. PH5-8]MDH6325550.1 NADP-dependent alcohol dehydrogenase [Parabacteroides sp. PH5-41]
MNNFEFCNPVKVVFGKETISRLPFLIPEGSRVLMLYGGGSIKKNGIYEQVTAALKAYTLLEFSGIEANPHYETCMQAVELVKKEKVDFLLAVGGGSVIDATKFIASAVYFEGDPWDILAKGAPIKKVMPLGAVLTLAATGSEMNERAVISRVSLQKKLNFSSPLVFPRFAVMDPEVTYSLPAHQVANGVVDSFIHVIEQYLTYPVNAQVQDLFAESLMKVIVSEGLKVLDNPRDYDIRANLMWAATNALNGWIGQGVPQDWSSHRIGYALTAQFGLDHAETLVVILPGVMRYLQKEKQEKILRMGAVVFGITEGSVQERLEKSIEATEGFFRNMGLKTRLSEYGIKESDLDKLVEPITQMGWKLGEHANIDARVAREILSLRL